MFKQILIVFVINYYGYALSGSLNDSSDTVITGSVNNEPGYSIWDKDITNLRQDLLKGYDKYIPPVDRANRNITDVTILLFLRFVNDFDEVAGHLESTILIQAWWKDTRLSWEPSKYNGFDGKSASLIFDFKEIWVPNIILWNPINSFEILDPSNDHLLARVYSSAFVYYIIGAKITSHCTPNVKYFPFDRHNCFIQLLTYESLYFPNQIKINSKNIENGYGFGENPQWIVSVGEPEVSDFLGQGIYVATFPITLERRSLFLVLNLFVPILLLSFINVFVFAIPIQAGERSSFAITVFLALAVYMTVVASNIPHSSKPMPLWSYFLLFKLIYSAAIALCSTIIMRLSNKTTPLSRCLKRIVKWKIWSFSKGIKIKEDEIMSMNSTQDASNNQKNTSVTEDNMEDHSTDIDLSWKEAAYVLDKLFMVFFLFVAFLESIFTFTFTYLKI